mmetsp:Transcript_82105/g.199057  ORF Transcript_82105/g.199057 Transcript_82105/m.199057 type:complete len:161 (+) Transcript_82105:26-508(+)
MGLITSVLFVGLIQSPEILARMYARRGVVMAILGVLNILGAFMIPSDFRSETWAFPGLIACGIVTLAASGCCFMVSSRRGAEATQFAMYTLAAFVLRTLFYLSLDATNLSNGYYDGADYILIVLQVALSAAYLYFLFIGYQKWRAFGDGSGAPLAGNSAV